MIPLFGTLKNKLKGLFKRTPRELEETEPEKPVAGADAHAQEPTEGLSRKERARLAKQERKAATKSPAVDPPMVGGGGKRIKEDTLDDLLWDLEIALMEADVARPVVEDIRNGVRDKLLGQRHGRQYTVDQVIEASIKGAVHDVLKVNEFDFDAWFAEQPRPVSIMFVGINGTGKTTTIAKIANRLQKGGYTVVLAAGDTFRAGAIEQLTIHADKLGTRIVKHAQNSDPAAVAYDAVEHAKAKRRDAVLIDTAGRMQTNSNLIDEMKKIVKVVKPTLKVFVGDSLAGNDAVEQARVFDEAVGIDAVILTKIDADSKGGAALSIAHTIGKPIAFVSNGQGYEDIIKFNADWMMERLFS